MNANKHRLKICLLFLSFYIELILGGPDQRRLLKYLLTEKQYDPLERPVANDTHTLPVILNLALQQIIDYDGKNEVMMISGWMVLTWKDYSLTWDPEEFGNIQTLRLPSSNIWTPDILLYNSADEKFDATMKVNAVVQHTGDILYVPPGIFKSICPFDIAAFPFDTQTCTLKFGSWTFDDTGLNLTAESNKGQLDAYIKSAEWDLEDFSAKSNTLKYDCCPDLYPYVLFTMRIRRRSLYYFTNIVVPCFLISCMTILGFLLAPDSGEKLTLQITILLSVVMFSLLMSEIMPPSSSAIPIITVYFLCVMSMSTLSVVASVLVISLHFRNSKNYTMPMWVRKYICYYLAWLLWMNRPRHDLTWRSIRRRWASPAKDDTQLDKLPDEHYHKSPSAPLLKHIFEWTPNHVDHTDIECFSFPNNHVKKRSDSLIELYHPPTPKIHRSDPCPDLSKIPHSQPGPDFSKIPHSQTGPDLSKACHSNDMEVIRSELRVIISQLTKLAQHTQQQAVNDDEAQDWKFVAMVIDRLCLIIFSVSMIVFTLLTLCSTPNFFKLQ